MRRRAVLHLARLRQTVLVDRIVSAAALVSVVGAELAHRLFDDLNDECMERDSLVEGKFLLGEPCSECQPAVDVALD